MVVHLLVLGCVGPSLGFQFPSLSSRRQKVSDNFFDRFVVSTVRGQPVQKQKFSLATKVRSNIKTASPSRGTGTLWAISSFRWSNFQLNSSTGDDDSPTSDSKIQAALRLVWRAVTYPFRAIAIRPVRKLLKKFRRTKEHVEDAAPVKVVEEEDSTVQVEIKPPETLSGTEVLSEVIVDDDLERTVDETKAEAVAVAVELPKQEKVPKKKLDRKTEGVPVGDRWAVSAPSVDLSGEWTILVNDEFKKEYDEYLKKLGQPFIVRSVAVTIISVTTEMTRQSEHGRALLIRGQNARGVWERTLVSSGTEPTIDDYTPLKIPVETADDELVEVESWWEEQGTVHRSWMLGISKYGGGAFESRRYLEQNGKVLVCESTFHPQDKKQDSASITWRFLRNGETLDDE